MQKEKTSYLGIVIGLGLVLTFAGIANGDVCKGYGPQAPRDIENRSGENRSNFSLAPKYTELNLCNLHFHVNVEHKAKDFSIYAGDGVYGLGGGYKCNMSRTLQHQSCENLKPTIAKI